MTLGVKINSSQTSLIFEPTCAHARWALMRRLASVRLSSIHTTQLMLFKKKGHGSGSKVTWVKVK